MDNSAFWAGLFGILGVVAGVLVEVVFVWWLHKHRDVREARNDLYRVLLNLEYDFRWWPFISWSEDDKREIVQNIQDIVFSVDKFPEFALVMNLAYTLTHTTSATEIHSKVVATLAGLKKHIPRPYQKTYEQLEERDQEERKRQQAEFDSEDNGE